MSVAAACALLALKLTAGIASGSLGLVSEALHSGTDLVAALLTFFAVGVAVRPADAQHQYGHGKAEHLAALFEASVLARRQRRRCRARGRPPRRMDRDPGRRGLVGVRS